MRIYVDFDDCLCETGRAFSKLVLECSISMFLMIRCIILNWTGLLIWMRSNTNLRFWCLTDHGTENVLFRMATIKDAPIGRAFAGLLQVSEKENDKE